MWETKSYEDAVELKPRPVASKNLKKEAVHYLDTFSSIPATLSTRRIPALALNVDSKFTHSDLEQASSQSSPDGGIFLHLLRGCGERSRTVVRLSNILHSLHQTPGVTNKYMELKLKEFGSRQCLVDL